MELPLFVPPSEKHQASLRMIVSPLGSVSYKSGKKGVLRFSSDKSSCRPRKKKKSRQRPLVGNEMISLYLLDLTLRRASWKCVFEFPFSSRNRLLEASTAKKWRLANTSSTQTNRLCSSRCAAAPACTPDSFTR